MRRYSRLVLAIGILFVLALLILTHTGANPLVAPDQGTLRFSGTLEAQQTHVAPEVNERAMRVAVEKGDAVKRGDLLVGLDTSSIKASLTEAESAVRTAQANLDQVKESARPASIALAQSNVKQAQAEVDAANRALDDASKAVASPQDLTAQIHMVEAQVSASEGQVAAAQASIASVKSQLDPAQNDQSMAGKYQYQALQKQQEAAQATLAAAQAGLDGNRRVLDMYRQMLANPLELLAAQHAAQNQVHVAQAGLQVAQRQLDIVQRGAQPEAVALAQTKLDAANASLNLLQLQMQRYAITSPVSGVVVDRSINAGETTRQGTAVITIADTTEYQMTLYIPIRNLDAIRVGQMAKITLPSIPGKSYQGQVTYIAPQAEFKPDNLYNSQDRSEVVFSIRLNIPNTNNELKAGLPADASFD